MYKTYEACCAYLCGNAQRLYMSGTVEPKHMVQMVLGAIFLYTQVWVHELFLTRSLENLAVASKKRALQSQRSSNRNEHALPITTLSTLSDVQAVESGYQKQTPKCTRNCGASACMYFYIFVLPYCGRCHVCMYVCMYVCIQGVSLRMNPKCDASGPFFFFDSFCGFIGNYPKNEPDFREMPLQTAERMKCRRI